MEMLQHCPHLHLTQQPSFFFLSLNVLWIYLPPFNVDSVERSFLGFARMTYVLSLTPTILAISFVGFSALYRFIMDAISSLLQSFLLPILP